MITRICMKEPSKSDPTKKSVKVMEEGVKGGNVKVEIVHLDGQNVADKGAEENNADKGSVGVMDKEKELEEEVVQRSPVTEMEKGLEV